MRRLTPFLLAPLLAAAACAPRDAARGWECIAPAAAGGGWDLTCRSVGRVLGELGLAPGLVRTTNLPGAGGGVAFAHAVSRRQGDPTVLVAASPATTLRLAQGLYGRLDEDDVRWLGAVGAEFGIVAVRADAPWRSLGDLMAAWKADPSSLVAAGGSPVAGQDHVKLLLLARAAGVPPRSVRYVPFDGGGEALTTLLGGFIQVFSGEASEIEGQLAAGGVRVLAVLSPDRLDGVLEGVPTAREQGFDVTWTTWRGFYAPGGVDDGAYRGWVATLERMAASPEWEEARRRARIRPYLVLGEAFEAQVRREVETFRALSAEMGFLP